LPNNFNFFILEKNLFFQHSLAKQYSLSVPKKHCLQNKKLKTGNYLPYHSKSKQLNSQRFAQNQNKSKSLSIVLKINKIIFAIPIKNRTFAAAYEIARFSI